MSPREQITERLHELLDTLDAQNVPADDYLEGVVARIRGRDSGEYDSDDYLDGSDDMAAWERSR